MNPHALRTGRRPILAAGNSGGDRWLLRMAAGGSPSLALVINHDDPREFVYSRPSLLAKRPGSAAGTW